MTVCLLTKFGPLWTEQRDVHRQHNDQHCKNGCPIEDPHPGHRNDAVPPGVDPRKLQILAESNRRERPYILRGGAEYPAITLRRPVVPVLELGSLAPPSRGRIVVQRSPQPPATKPIPVRAGVKEVKMPHLI